MAISRSAGGVRLTRLPSIRMSPEVASSRPAMMRSSVDLPQPEGPTKTQNSPSLTSRSTPLMTSSGPKDLVTLVRVRWPMACPQSLTGWPVRTLSSAARQTRERGDGVLRGGG